MNMYEYEYRVRIPRSSIGITIRAEYRSMTDYSEIKRINNDIVSIEVHIEKMSDMTLIIRNFSLYFTNLPPIEMLKNKINEVYNDVCYQEGEGLMICEKECNIITNNTKTSNRPIVS